MRRMLLMLAAAALMAAMVVATAVPAFAVINCNGGLEPGGEVQTCSGGESISEPGGINNGAVGGGAIHTAAQCESESECEVFYSSGGGGVKVLGEFQGGGGGRCDLRHPECVGGSSF